MRRPFVCVLLLALAALHGCCSRPGGLPIVVETTISRLELPERPSRVVTLAAGIGENVPVVLTRDQIAQAPAADQAQVENDAPRVDCDDDEFDNLFGRIDLCLARRVSLGYSRRNGGPRMGHVRLYLAGRDREHARQGNFSLALSGAWGRDERSEHDITGDGSYHTTVERSERNYGLILGYRADDALLIYGGPYHLRTDFDVEHERPNEPRQSSAGEARARGGHLGLAFLFDRHTTMLLEYSRASVSAADSERDLGRWSASYQFAF